VLQPQCQELFDTYNQRFFGGRLPPYRIILSDRYSSGMHGICRKKQREILLRTSLPDKELPRVLLHEMAHAAVPKSGHGKLWLAEMLRLAEMGAPTREDWETYQNPPKTARLREAAADAYDAGGGTDASWRVVRYQIGSMYGLTDDTGRAVSKSAARALRRCWKEFRKGRREFLSSIP
jgi:hypothetical protein